MAYSTKAQFRIQFPLITVTNLADASVDQFISQADSEIDILLNKAGHDTPISTVPCVVTGLSTFITGKFAALAMGVSEQSVILPEMWELIIDEIVRLELLISDLPLDPVVDTYKSPVSIGQKGLNESNYSNFELNSVVATNFGDDS